MKFLSPHNRHRALLRDCLAVTLVFAVMHLVVMPIACHSKCPYSVYFSISDERAQQMVEQQEHEAQVMAEQYFQQLDGPSSLAFHRDRLEQALDVVLCIVSVRRPGQNYLLHSASKLDLQIKTNGIINMGLFVCDAEANRDNRTAHEQAVRVGSYVPVYHVHENETGVQLEQGMHKKQTLDFTKCLSRASSFNGRFVLMLEDDAVVLPNALHNLNLLLSHKLLWRKDWIFTKLNFQDWLKGYEMLSHSIMELLIFSSVGSSLLWLLTLRIMPRKRSTAELAILWLLVTTHMVVLVLAIGRQHLWIPLIKKLLPFHLVEAPAANLMAVLFPKKWSSIVANYLADSPVKEVDLALADMADHGTKKAFYVEGDFFRNVGYVSSLQRHDRSAKNFLLV